MHKGAYVIELVAADVIQIENHRIRLAAFKAAMNTQIFNELPTVRLDSLACGFGHLHDHSDSVPYVVLATVLGIATPTLGLKSVCATLVKVEFRADLFNLADEASFHLGHGVRWV